MDKYVFDLDNTLVYTDSLNNDSYNYALNRLGLTPINNCKRITRKIVFEKFTNLNDIQKNQIIELKQQYFINNLQKTVPNTALLQTLKTKNAESCLLWTSAYKTRVLAILEYYQICNEFKMLLFSNKVNVLQDVEKICALLQCRHEDLIFYEDNQKVIHELQRIKLKVIPVEILTKVKGFH